MEDLKEIRVLNLCQDDVLVFKFENVLSREYFNLLNKDIRAELNRIGIKNNFLILDSNCSLEIIKKTSYHIQVSEDDTIIPFDPCQMGCATCEGEKS